MTATQVFLMFLKKRCTRREYFFFMEILSNNHGNKFFKNRRLFTNTFVEDYLSRNNRALNNFMIRLFVLAPNLKYKSTNNVRLGILRNEFNARRARRRRETMNDVANREERFPLFFGIGMYVTYYRREWNRFLRECIVSEKKFGSPFKKGESYDFKLRDDIHL